MLPSKQKFLMVQAKIALMEYIRAPLLRSDINTIMYAKETEGFFPFLEALIFIMRFFHSLLPRDFFAFLFFLSFFPLT